MTWVESFSRFGSLQLGIALITGTLVGLAILLATSDLEEKLRVEDDRRADEVRADENRRADERRLADARLENLRFVRSFNGISEAPLRSLDLRGQVLDSLQLPKANLSGSNLTEASLYQAELIDIDMFDAVLVCTDLNEARLGGGAILKRSKFLSADLRDVDLSRADLDGVVFGSADGYGYEYADPTDLRGATFTGIRNLQGATFVPGGVVLDDEPLGWPEEIPVPASADAPPDRPGEQCGPLRFR